MTKIPLEEACNLLDQDPVCNKGFVTPYILIVKGIVQYKDWVKALERYRDRYSEKFHSNYDLFQDTAFGLKLKKYVNKLGWDGFEVAPQFRRRSDDTVLESIRLINMKLTIFREEEI